MHNLQFQCIKTSIVYVFLCFFCNLRYKEDPWLWDLEWDVQEFKLKKVAASKKKSSKKAAETKAATPLPVWEEGRSLAVFSWNITTIMKKGVENNR